MIAALDLGANLGYAFLKDNKLQSGCTDLKKNAKTLGARFLAYKNFLLGLKGCSVVAYEKVYRHTGTIASHQYGFYEGDLIAFCFENNIKLVELNVADIKKYATGKSRAKKEDVINCINNKFNLKITDDNEADAIAALYCYLER